MNLRHWIQKFRCAGIGIQSGARGQSSFVVHYTIAALVLVLAGFLQCEAWQWCILLLCIGLVISLEYVNSAIEHLAKGLCKEHNQEVGTALDIASAAVLFASLVSAVIGVIIFATKFVKWLV